MKTKLTYKEYIAKLSKFCREAIFAGEYEVILRWSKHPDSDDDPNSDECTYARINVNSSYLIIVLTIYPECEKKFKSKKYRDLGRIVLHEYCHVLTHPLAELYEPYTSPLEKVHARSTLERQTQRICNAIDSALPENWYLPEKLNE